MNKVEVLLDRKEFKTAPTCREIVHIKNSIIEKTYSVSCGTMQSFVSFVGESGCAFLPATFKPSFYDIFATKETFKQMQMFVLEFNGTITLEEVLDRANLYELPVLFAYEPIDSTNQGQFRVVFLNDLPIKYVQVAEIIIEALLTIFPEADIGSKDVTKIYLGGRKILYCDNSMNTINVETLFRNMCLYLRDTFGKCNYRRKIIDFSNRSHLSLNDSKYLDVSITTCNGKEIDNTSTENLLPNSIIYIIESGKEFSYEEANKSAACKSRNNNFVYKIRVNKNQATKKDIILPDNKSHHIHKEFRSNNLSLLDSGCKLFRNFKEGTRILSTKELLGISSNLIHVETGSKIILTTLQKHSYFDVPKRYSDWSFYIKYMTKNNYECLPCNTFCPYKDHCHHATDILTTAKPKHHEITELQNINNIDDEFYPLDEAAADLELNFIKAIEKPIIGHFNNTHVINSSTGVGKSTTVLNYLTNHPEGQFVIGTPTIDLKNMYYKAAMKRGINAIKTPSLTEYKDKLPEHVWKHIQKLYEIQKHSAVYEYIKTIIAKRSVDREALLILKQYMKDMDKFRTFKGTIFTTHNMIATMSLGFLNKFDAVIFDEDPLLNYMIANQIEIPIEKLKDVLAEVGSKSDLGAKILTVLSAVEHSTWFETSEIRYENSYEHIKAEVNIPDFCLATKFYFRKAEENSNCYEKPPKEDSIVFFKPFKLNKNVKYIVLSATANEKIYNYFFGSKSICFHDCKKAQYVGKLKQYTHYPTSKAFIKTNPDIVKNMIKLGDTDNIITFQGEEYGVTDCHFGKTTGINTYKGKDLTIIGTYHRPMWLYKLLAFTINSKGFGLHKDAVMKYQPIEYNGFKFQFMTFDKSSELLRDIQLWMIESELEQAVGRARLTRYNCTVHVFSNFPLKQAQIDNVNYGRNKNEIKGEKNNGIEISI